LINTANNIEFEIQHDYSVKNSPFLLENDTGYQQWKKTKLERYSLYNPNRIIKIPGHACLRSDGLAEFAVQLQTFNFSFFEIDTAGKTFSTDDFLKFGCQFGLHRVDANSCSESNGVTLISVAEPSDKRSRYIPYTTRALSWHTDGYYNPIDSRIDAFSLYCVNPAGQGGNNFILDHEMVYMQVRDTDPELLVALMDPSVMVVPANISNKRVVRGPESGPVFIVDNETGRLNMRYSSRPQNIGWKPDALTKRAVNLVRELLMDSGYIAKLKLKNGQGIICNNVLHGRSAFMDGPTGGTSRMYYRARYYDAVTFPDDL